MGTMAAIIGAIGGFCAVMGIITAAEVIPVIMPGFTWSFWFALSGILFLCAIAFTTGRSGD